MIFYGRLSPAVRALWLLVRRTIDSCRDNAPWDAGRCSRRCDSGVRSGVAGWLLRFIADINCVVSVSRRLLNEIVLSRHFA
jgi:hypothetical protein